jgi:two-component system sensor histidine kinase/response regulator
VQFDELKSDNPGKVILVYSVKDDGIGMSEDFVKIIFCQFTRAMDVKSRQEEGTGLGMAIAKQIVDEMDGKIDIKSTEGEGSTFTVMIEADTAEPPETDDSEEQQENSDTDLIVHGSGEVSDNESIEGMSVLIAEDNDLNWEVISEQLKSYGINAKRACNGAECVRKFSESDVRGFDVIFMDLRMPVMDGLRAASEIRKLDREDAGDIPIIAMTASTLSDDIRLCMAAGMQGHVAKPIDIKEVVKVLCKVKKKC